MASEIVDNAVKKTKTINKWHTTIKAETAVEALKQRGFGATYVDTMEQIKDLVLGMVSKDATIAFGGSFTLLQSGILEALQQRGNEFITQIGKFDLEQNRKAFMADVFLTSANAISTDGYIVNIDGRGNRVAASIFGPRKVICIVGVNKIAEDLESAINRARNVAAPKNAKRFERGLPCEEDGICTDCDSPSRICKVLTILERKPSSTDYEVIIVGEELGF